MPSASQPCTRLDGEKERIRGALSHLDASDHEVWVRVGMALFAWAPGDRGKALWEDWSRTSPTYDASKADRYWGAFGQMLSGETLQSLFQEASLNGWTGNHDRESDGIMLIGAEQEPYDR